MLELIATLKLSTFVPGFLGWLLAGLINHASSRECLILIIIGSIASYSITPIFLSYGFGAEWATGVGIMIGYLARPLLEEVQKKLPASIVNKIKKNI